MITAPDSPPILQTLAACPEWTFTLIGSRAYAPSKIFWDTDWDYLIDGNGREDGQYKQDASFIGEYLEGLGFVKVQVGGYSADRHVYHYRWRGKRPEPRDHTSWQVDVLVMHREGFQRRLQVLEEVSKLPKLYSALRRDGWGEFWQLLQQMDWRKDRR